jgi:hypothetical protein
MFVKHKPWTWVHLDSLPILQRNGLFNQQLDGSPAICKLAQLPIFCGLKITELRAPKVNDHNSRITHKDIPQTDTVMNCACAMNGLQYRHGRLTVEPKREISIVRKCEGSAGNPLLGLGQKRM